MNLVFFGVFLVAFRGFQWMLSWVSWVFRFFSPTSEQLGDLSRVWVGFKPLNRTYVYNVSSEPEACQPIGIRLRFYR